MLNSTTKRGQKKCNAIVHSVWADDYRMFYEKPDVITFKGTEMTMTEAYGRAALIVARLWLIEQKIGFQAWLKSRQAERYWPPHNLMCECSECSTFHVDYRKALGSK